MRYQPQGQTAPMCMPFSSSAGAADRMNFRTPALAAQYVGGELQCRPRPATDAVSRMLPACTHSGHHTSPSSHEHPAYIVFLRHACGL